MNKQHSMVTGIRVIALLVTAAAGLLSILATNDNGADDNQGYAVAFPVLAAEGVNTRVRWSADGASWSDGAFPVGFGDGSGNALAAVPDKTLFIAGWQTNGQVRMQQGLGTGNWSGTPIAAIPSEVARSAPSLVFMEQGKWLVAFRAQSDTPNVGDRVVLRVLDTSVSPPRYLAGNRFGYPGQDTHSLGRPAVAYVNGKVLLTWVTTPARLHLAVGQLAGDNITWQGHSLFELTEPNCNPLRSDPVLSHDHSAFYLGFLCSNNTLPPTGASMYIHRSADGLNWSHYGNWDKRPDGIRLGANIGIAGRADGSLIGAAITMGPNPQFIVARCAGGDACKESGNTTWQAVDWQAVFGPRAPDGKFAFIATGHPAE